MLKKRPVTILTTAALLLTGFVIYSLHKERVIYESPFLALIMLSSTAVYVFGSCVLQTFGKVNASIILGAVVFFILCACLFYSVSIVDFIVFFICIALVIRKSNKICSCLKDCENPLR